MVDFSPETHGSTNPSNAMALNYNHVPWSA